MNKNLNLVKELNSIPTNTKVMASKDGRAWCFRYYAKDKKCAYGGYKYKKGSYIDTYDYIVPLDLFDFDDIESNKNKTI